MFRETHRAFSVKFEVCDVIVRQRQLHIEEEKVELQLNMFQEFRDILTEQRAHLKPMQLDRLLFLKKNME